MSTWQNRIYVKAVYSKLGCAAVRHVYARYMLFTGGS